MNKFDSFIVNKMKLYEANGNLPPNQDNQQNPSSKPQANTAVGGSQPTQQASQPTQQPANQSTQPNQQQNQQNQQNQQGQQPKQTADQALKAFEDALNDPQIGPQLQQKLAALLQEPNQQPQQPQ